MLFAAIPLITLIALNSLTPSTLIAQNKALRDNFNTKLTEIKDVRKKAVIERIDGKIAALNQRRTTELTNHLAKIQTVLDRLESKGATTASITSAQTAIDAAQAAVLAQAAKKYTMTISTESALKSAAKTMVEQFRADFKATHQAVINARQAVADVAKELAKTKTNE